MCYFGQEPAPDRPGRLLWTVPGTAEDRCSCTALRPGAVNTQTLGRPYEPFYTDRPLFTDNRVEIYDFFNCPEFATNGPGMQEIVPTSLEGTTTVSPCATTNLPVTTANLPSATTNPPGTTINLPSRTTNLLSTTTDPLTDLPSTTDHASGTATSPPDTNTNPPGTTTNLSGPTSSPPGTTTNLPSTTTDVPSTITNPPITMMSSPPSTTTDPPSTTTDVSGSTTNPPDGAVRLVNGQTPNQGRVEIYYNGEWGTVCDDTWDITDGNVVCLQLGYPSAAQVYSHAIHGEGTGPIHLDNTHCTGSETRLGDCPHLGWGMHNCHHYEDASVKCTTTM